MYNKVPCLAGDRVGGDCMVKSNTSWVMVTLPDGVELDGVLLGLTHHLGDHRQVRHLHRGPAELEDDDEESIVREPGRYTAVGRTQQAVDQQQRERYRYCYRTWNVTRETFSFRYHETDSSFSSLTLFYKICQLCVKCLAELKN